MQIAFFRWAAFLLILILTPMALAGDPPPRPAAELALESIFSPRRAPAAKTMGLLQRSFLDLVEVTQPKLEVAVVVDGTESMGESLGGIRRAIGMLVEDLQRYKGQQAAFQLVVYRDLDAPSGEVQFPLNTSGLAFSSDRELIVSAVAKLQAESGAPYFPELTDLGIHKALTELAWSEDDQTSRWLLVFADAPPFDPGFDEAASGSRRRFDTQQLVHIASRKGIKINCVLCPSRDEDRAAYTQLLDRTQQFLNRLATDTGGLMLDLSYPDIRQALEQAAAAQPVAYREIGRITRGDVDAARAEAAARQPALAPEQRLRLVVLPHLPLASMAFEPDRAEVQLAAELRHKLRMLPRVEVKSPVAAERQLAALRARGLADAQLLQTLASVLDVDYVVWGTMSQQDGSVLVESAIYDRVAGRRLVQKSIRTSADLPATHIGGQLASDLLREAAGSGADRQLAAAFSRLPGDPRFATALLTPVSNAAPVRSELLAGLETLEHALAFPAGDPAGLDLLAKAESHLAKAGGPSGDPANPLGQMLLGSCLFNRAQSLLNAGQAEQAAAHSRRCLQAVNNAYRFRNNSEYDFLKTEIEADYDLLVKKDFAAAIQRYEQLAQGDPQTPLTSALRANWMLAGIYSGDWGTPAEFTDQAKSRQRLIRILALWPESREAEFIRRNLRWDETKGGSQFAHFPQEQNAVVAQMAAAEH